MTIFLLSFLPLRRVVGVCDRSILVGVVDVDVLGMTCASLSPSSHFPGLVSRWAGEAVRCGGLDVFKKARVLWALCERSVRG